MRWLWSFLAAVLFVFASFILMLIMIFPPKNTTVEPELKMGYFIPKQQQESSDPSRTRQQMPEKPVEPQPETPPTQQAPQPPRTPQVATLDLAVPQLSSSISVATVAAPSLQGLTAQTPAPVAPAAPAAAPAAPSAPSNDSEVIPLNQVLPVYPDSARRRGIEGYVKLAFTITAEGKVENVRVIEASPENVFNREARRAAVRWRFAPRREGGQLVEREAVKTLQFRLEKRGR
ncbi:energy transducer TonB [Pseudomonas sp. C27(2019)]|uniref:energy transducer TonB n=1 Tax=Pseudomonas sp. C27(2019) TaxID=2604941 RepID=UPI001244C645|nr:energy transducer TonB [Pseudomonas sp. C27(2019)]QEY58759.1 energy transducer TonB [Pseudomonas sp. C27(2019)]